MSRLPLDVIEIEFGEDANYTPPADADRWAAALRTNIMAPMDYTANPGITHGGPPPEYRQRHLHSVAEVPRHRA